MFLLPTELPWNPAPDQIARDRALALLKPLLEDEKAHKVGQNLKYDRGILAELWHRTAWQSPLTPCSNPTFLTASLADTIWTASRTAVAEHKTITFEEIAGKGKNQLTFNQIALEEAGRYAAEDADVTLQLHLKMWPELQQHKGPLNVFKKIDMPLVPVLSRVERNGVKIDPGCCCTNIQKS